MMTQVLEMMIRADSSGELEKTILLTETDLANVRKKIIKPEEVLAILQGINDIDQV